MDDYDIFNTLPQRLANALGSLRRRTMKEGRRATASDIALVERSVWNTATESEKIAWPECLPRDTFFLGRKTSEDLEPKGGE